MPQYIFICQGRIHKLCVVQAIQSLAKFLAQQQQHAYKQPVGEGGAAVNSPTPGGAVSGLVDVAGAGVWPKAGSSAASSGSGLGGIGAGSQGGLPVQAPVLFRAPVAARVTAGEARNYFFASSHVPAPAAKFQIGAWSDMMLQQCALILNQELNFKGAKVKYKFIPSVFFQEHCIFLSEVISEGQVVGILQPMSQKGGAIVLAIGQIEKDGHFIRLYRCESISGSSRPADVQWTRDTILHHANEVIVTFFSDICSAVSFCPGRWWRRGVSPWFRAKTFVTRGVFHTDDWIPGVVELNPRLVCRHSASSQQKVQTSTPRCGEGRRRRWR